MHRLSVSYRLATPAAELGGNDSAMRWSAGPRLRWSFGMSDLSAGRYLEAWFPSNLPFDQFPCTLEIRIVGTRIGHSLITNGAATTAGANAWSVRFPASFTSMSPLVEIHPGRRGAGGTRNRRPSGLAADGSGRSVAKRADGPEDLSAGVAQIKALLSANEREYGEFLGTRFVCFFHGEPGGMEYNQATTTSAAALGHETFHSWFARGITPASPADGWVGDEAFTRFHDDGADRGRSSSDFTMPPVPLCSREPFQRTTPAASYVEGRRFFLGLAASMGPARLRDVMRVILTRNDAAHRSRRRHWRVTSSAPARRGRGGHRRRVPPFRLRIPASRHRPGTWIRGPCATVPGVAEPLDPQP